MNGIDEVNRVIQLRDAGHIDELLQGNGDFLQASALLSNARAVASW